MQEIMRSVLLALIIGIGGGVPADAQDAYKQMPDGESKDIVYGVCSGCHSIRLVMQQGMSRKRWDKLLDWMVEKQGMAPLTPEIEEQVLDYLSANFGEDEHQAEGQRGDAPSPFGSVQPLMPPQ